MTENKEKITEKKKTVTADEIAEQMAANMRENIKDPEFLEKRQARRDEAIKKVRNRTGFKAMPLEEVKDTEKE